MLGVYVTAQRGGRDCLWLTLRRWIRPVCRCRRFILYICDNLGGRGRQVFYKYVLPQLQLKLVFTDSSPRNTSTSNRFSLQTFGTIPTASLMLYLLSQTPGCRLLWPLLSLQLGCLITRLRYLATLVAAGRPRASRCCGTCISFLCFGVQTTNHNINFMQGVCLLFR
ncbi:hypothetical protein LZ30DRAFT_743883 [Colletotrichum cereale]|nr:hypothetical protein LZ30DRAFT_743883 [Colletotrichum cereale]